MALVLVRARRVSGCVRLGRRLTTAFQAIELTDDELKILRTDPDVELREDIDLKAPAPNSPNGPKVNEKKA